MNLDDYEAFAALDPQDVLSEIEALPAQLSAAWDLSQTLALPAWTGLRQVTIIGMGAAALGADLARVYIAPVCPVPVVVLRNYALPAFARGPETLVIAVSYAGESEETLAAFEQAAARGCRLLVLTSGGSLAAAASQAGAVAWLLQTSSRRGAAVGEIFGLLLGALSRLGLIANPTADVRGAVAALQVQQARLGATVPIRQNEAKRLAGQCVGRWLAIFGTDHLEPVAHYWKLQLNALAKTWAQHEPLPEADHSTILGNVNPAALTGQTMLLFLRARSCHPRNQLRTEITKEFFMLEGWGTDFFNAPGETTLAQMWTALHFGDYLAYYLAMLYGVDPNPTDTVEGLKAYLQET